MKTKKANTAGMISKRLAGQANGSPGEFTFRRNDYTHNGRNVR